MPPKITEEFGLKIISRDEMEPELELRLLNKCLRGIYNINTGNKVKSTIIMRCPPEYESMVYTVKVVLHDMG